MTCLCLSYISVTGDSTNEVTAYSGGGIRIKCKYDDGHETNKKYFCKGESTPCADQIKTGAKHTWVHEGRFSVHDNTSAKVFWVVMRNLTVEDSGTYQCGVDIERWTDTYRPVKLKVNAGEFSSMSSITALLHHTTSSSII
uniref:Ig-like domain-containing protein n=1 Tax=Electrophorus electricus TaxID=8005 RepID=A0A4W4F1J6_ELEEL